MKPAKRSSLFLPSIADILFLCIFLFLSFAEGNRLLADGDTGHHIRTGEYIIDTLTIPRHDIFSFLSPPIPWTAHAWLSEVIMAVIHRAFGLTGIVVFFAFLIASVYYLLFKVIQTYKGNILGAILVVILVIAASLIHWMARPHIFSLLLMVAWYYILDSYQYNNRNYLYVLPPIMLLWVNLHGGFMAGFILIGVYLFGNLFGFFVSQEDKRISYKKKAELLGLTVIACILTSLINPHGYHILTFPFELTSNRLIVDNVNEYMSPNFHEPIPFKYLLLLMIAAFAISKKELNVMEVVLALVFTYMALYSTRFIPLFAIIIAPILVKQADLIFEQADGRFFAFLKKRSDVIVSADAASKGFLWPIAGILLTVVFAVSGKIGYGYYEEATPARAMDFLKKENIRGNMFNNDEFGDYIIYAAWPKYKVFFDGRFDMYGEGRMKEYLKVTRVQPGWKDVLEKYKIDWIIYNANSPLSLFLMERDDWKLIYADKVANIFVKDTPDNRYLINKYSRVNPETHKDN